MENEISLNKVMQAIKPSQVTVLAGAPGSGKTTLALNLAEQYVLSAGKAVAIFTIEMSRESCIKAIFCMSAEVSIKKANACDFSQEEWQKIASVRDSLHKSFIFIDDSCPTTVQDIIQKCEDVNERFGRLDLVIVDYLQLLGPGYTLPTTSAQINKERTDRLNELDLFAKKMEVPILILSQLYRADRYCRAANEITGSVTISNYSGFKGTWLLLRRDKDSDEAEVFCAQGEIMGERIPLKFNKEFLSFRRIKRGDAMKNSRTLNFLKTTKMAVITCADEKLLSTYFSFIVPIYERKYEKTLDECEVKEFILSNFSDKDILVVNGMTAAVPRKEISQKLAELMENQKEKQIFVPLQCGKYSELRSIYFHLPDYVKPDVQIFVLRETEVGVKLECELGENAGWYILYDYDKTTGTFTEKD